jgi:hypothetical protein
MVACSQRCGISYLCRRMKEQHAPYAILKMSINGALTMQGLPFWVVYVAINRRPQLSWSWQPPYPDNQVAFPPQPPRQLQLILFTMLQLRVQDHFSLEKWSKHHTYAIPDTARNDYPWWKAKYHSCSFDANFQDGAGSVALSLGSIQAANTLIV